MHSSMDSASIRPHSANTLHRHEVSPTTTLHGNQALGLSDTTQDTSTPVSPTEESPSREQKTILVIDWDGPEDPKNPKKCVG